MLARPEAPNDTMLLCGKRAHEGANCAEERVERAEEEGGDHARVADHRERHANLVEQKRHEPLRVGARLAQAAGVLFDGGDARVPLERVTTG